MRALKPAAVMAVAICLASCRGEVKLPELRGAGEASVAERVSVLSGDTFILDGKGFRLANAFAPEPIPRARCWAEALAAKQAAREVQQMFREAESIEVKPTGDRDEYNRQFALVTLGGLDLGQSLYEEGLAGQPGTQRFPWCDPISQNAPGAPTVYSLMELKPR
ncbi:MAG TPA: nuclease [Phenylobacterium sp.]